MPKIAITVSAEGWNAAIDERFGRAAGFALLTPSGSGYDISYIPNTQNRQSDQGAGIQAAETVASAGAEILLTGHVGPKAFSTLMAAGIRIYTGISGSAETALKDYEAGRLLKSSGADVKSHW